MEAFHLEGFEGIGGRRDRCQTDVSSEHPIDVHTSTWIWHRLVVTGRNHEIYALYNVSDDEQDQDFGALYEAYYKLADCQDRHESLVGLGEVNVALKKVLAKKAVSSELIRFFVS